MKDLKQPVGAVSLFCDNQSAIILAKKSFFQARTKHVEIHFHFIREKVLQGEINLDHIQANQQIIDLFTKGLCAIKLESFRQELSIAKTRANVKRRC